MPLAKVPQPVTPGSVVVPLADPRISEHAIQRFRERVLRPGEVVERKEILGSIKRAMRGPLHAYLTLEPRTGLRIWRYHHEGNYKGRPFVVAVNPEADTATTVLLPRMFMTWTIFAEGVAEIGCHRRAPATVGRRWRLQPGPACSVVPMASYDDANDESYLAIGSRPRRLRPVRKLRA